MSLEGLLKLNYFYIYIGRNLIDLFNSKNKMLRVFDDLITFFRKRLYFELPIIFILVKSKEESSLRRSLVMIHFKEEFNYNLLFNSLLK